MATVLFFVHGTTVRGPALATIKNQLRDGLDDADVKIEAPPWGDHLGGDLDADFRRALPPQMRARGLDDQRPHDPERERWDFLLADPLAELRLAATTPAAPAVDGGLDIGRDHQLEGLPGRLARQVDAPIELEHTGLLRTDLDKALTSVASSPELQAASAGLDGDDEDDLIPLAVDAVIAQAAAEATDRGSFPPAVALQAQARDALRSRLLQAVAGDRGFRLPKWLLSTVLGAATELSRARLTGIVAVFLADVLVYTRHGDAIRRHLRDELAKFSHDQVLVVGHSLGGIAMVDLLLEKQPPANVHELVTAGSQAPLFALMEALASRKAVGATLPIPWTNVYDPYDLLGFYAGEVFAQVKDMAVDSGVSFPWAHSAYWTNQDVYDLLRATLARIRR